MPDPRRFRPPLLGTFLGCALVFPLGAQGSASLKGDLGLGAFAKRSPVGGREDGISLMPYGYATWGPAFWRVDTFGVETFHFGSGALELVGRIDLENATGTQSDLATLFRGENAVPVGLGTFQRGSWGGLFAHAYQDVGASRGQLAEVRYAAKVEVFRIAFYPQAAVEWRSAAFNQAYYGVEPGQAQGLPEYHAGASVSPSLALAAEWPLTQTWVLAAQVRRKWLDAEVSDSPKVIRHTLDDGYLALCYRFH